MRREGGGSEGKSEEGEREEENAVVKIRFCIY